MMTKFRNPAVLLAAALTVGLFAAGAHAQHDHLHEGDIFPEIVDGKFTTQSDLFLGEFAFPGGAFGVHGSTDDPGYNAEYDPAFNGDILYYRVLPVEGSEFLHFFSAADGDFAPTTRTLSIEGAVATSVIGEDGATNAENAIDQILNGALHAHLEMTLSDVSGGSVVADAVGLYGVLLQLFSLETVGGADTGVMASDPFFLVLNYGMTDEEAIDEALHEFEELLDGGHDHGHAVPTPTAAGMVALLSGGLMMRRRGRGR